MKIQNSPPNDSLSTGVSGLDNSLCRGLTTGRSHLIEGQISTAVDASYLADNVLMLRYFEHDGEVKQAISAFKKRSSLHECTISQFPMPHEGIRASETLGGFRGILTGVPVYLGTNNALCKEAGGR